VLQRHHFLVLLQVASEGTVETVVVGDYLVSLELAIGVKIYDIVVVVEELDLRDGSEDGGVTLDLLLAVYLDELELGDDILEARLLLQLLLALHVESLELLLASTDEAAAEKVALQEYLEAG